MAEVTREQAIRNAIDWLEYSLTLSQTPAPSDTPQSEDFRPRQIAWGAKVSPTFRERVLWIEADLGINADHLMACMAWESGETFSPSKKNIAGSGATGLIQFMPSTAVALGTTTAELARMTAEDQLNYVWKYFAPYDGKLKNLGDVYMAILWPKAVGQPDSYVLFDRGIAYRQNAGLDKDKNGKITREECIAKIRDKLRKGLLPSNVG